MKDANKRSQNAHPTFKISSKTRWARELNIESFPKERSKPRFHLSNTWWKLSGYVIAAPASTYREWLKLHGVYVTLSGHYYWTHGFFGKFWNKVPCVAHNLGPGELGTDVSWRMPSESFLLLPVILPHRCRWKVGFGSGGKVDLGGEKRGENCAPNIYMWYSSVFRKLKSWNFCNSSAPAPRCMDVFWPTLQTPATSTTECHWIIKQDQCFVFIFSSHMHIERARFPMHDSHGKIWSVAATRIYIFHVEEASEKYQAPTKLS